MPPGMRCFYGGKNMELKDTIEMMNSEDYKERFKAEYYQTKIRYIKLHKMTVKYIKQEPCRSPRIAVLNCSMSRKSTWACILHALEVRAEIEGVIL